MLEAITIFNHLYFVLSILVVDVPGEKIMPAILTNVHYLSRLKIYNQKFPRLHKVLYLNQDITCVEKLLEI